MSELEVRGLVKRVNGKMIVDHVSFRVVNDEFFVLLGPSGSGKTSVLRLVSGLDKPDEGDIFINGRDATKQEPFLRNVAVVFQDYGLFPTMDVFENIAYGLQIRKLPRKEVEMRVLMAAEMLELKPLLKRSLTNLSGGELQRVSIARVLVKDADIYLFDEPISQLDPRLRHRTRQEIAMVHRLKRKPSIYITHDQNEAFAMADRVGIISRGKIQQVGTPDELLLKPVNLFVARFLGSPPINIMEGYIQHTEARYRLRCDGMYFTFPARWTRALSRLGPQSKVLIGIRPNIIVPEWAFNELGNVPHVILRAQITHIESVIGKITVRLRIGYGTEITAEFDDNQVVHLHIGQVMNIAINPEKMYFFNPFSEETLTAEEG